MSAPILYHYHGGKEHARRLKLKTCRCGSVGIVYKLIDQLRNGLIYDPRQSEELLTTPKIRRYEGDEHVPGSHGKTFIYAINVDYDIHVAPDGERSLLDAVKHETLFHNLPVLAAGEIYFKEGIIHGINDLSGSYDTKGFLELHINFAQSVLKAIDRHGLPINELLRNELTSFTI